VDPKRRQFPVKNDPGTVPSGMSRSDAFKLNKDGTLNKTEGGFELMVGDSPVGATSIDGRVNDHPTVPISIGMYRADEESSATRIGTLQVKPSGEVHHVDTEPDYQRKGVATQLLNVAKSVASSTGKPAVKHSTRRTDSGDAWAKSTGDPVPPRLRKD